MLDLGARAVGDATQCHAVAIDARAPKFDGGIGMTIGTVFGRIAGVQAAQHVQH